MAYRVELTAEETENIIGGSVMVCDNGQVYQKVGGQPYGTIYFTSDPAAVNAWVTKNAWRYRCDSELLSAIVSEFELNAYSE